VLRCGAVNAAQQPRKAGDHQERTHPAANKRHPWPEPAADETTQAKGNDRAGARDPVDISRGRLYLNDEEATALNHDLDELLQRYDGGRTLRNKPADASPRDQYWLLLPHASKRDG
jgi:hypothetical protein